MAILKRSHLPTDFIKEVRGRLTEEIALLGAEEKRLVAHDPFFVPGRDVGNAETMDEAEEALGHERVETEMAVVRQRLEETQAALAKIKSGRYGICEKCRGRIDRARLEIFPQARYCVECEEKEQ